MIKGIYVIAAVVVVGAAYSAGVVMQSLDIERSCMHDQGQTIIAGHAFYCVDFYELQRAIEAQREQRGA